MKSVSVLGKIRLAGELLLGVYRFQPIRAYIKAVIAVGGKNGNGVMLSVRIIEIEELIIILKPSVNMRIFRFRNVIADGQENVLLHPFFILYGTIGPVADEHIGNAVCGNQRIQSFFPIAAWRRLDGDIHVEFTRYRRGHGSLIAQRRRERGEVVTEYGNGNFAVFVHAVVFSVFPAGTKGGGDEEGKP